MTTEKEAPHSKENEMTVLGCMLTSESHLKIGAETLSESDFYFSEHKILFSTIKAAYKENKPADVFLVSEDLKSRGKLKSVGDIGYITALAQYAGTSAYIEEYIERLKALSQQRLVIALMQTIQRKVLNGENVSIGEIQEELRRIEKNDGSANKFSIKSLNEFKENFLLTNPPKKLMLLDYANDKGVPTGFLPKGIVAMLTGAGGGGKTHLLAQLAISVSNGTRWLDTFTTTKHCGEGNKGNIFFGLGENQYDDIHRVLYKASKELRDHEPDILKEAPLMEASKRIFPFSFCGQNAAFIENGKPSQYFRQLKAKLIEMKPKGGWALIILDPVSRLMGADAETDNAAATQFIALLEELTIDLPGKPTVLFAHHISKAAQRENKPDQTAARGSSALTDGVRWQVNLSKDDKDKITLKMTKTNFTASFPIPIELVKDEDGFLKRLKGNSDKTKSTPQPKQKESIEDRMTR